MLNEEFLVQVEKEASDRVWYDRKWPADVYRNDKSLTEKHRKQILDAIEEVKTKYDIKEGECDDFYHGYWSGILALCRILLADEEFDFDIEDLREMNGCLLDT